MSEAAGDGFVDYLLTEMAADAEPEDQDGEAPASVAALGEELMLLRDMINSAEADVKALKSRRDVIAKALLPDAMKAAGLVGDNGKGSFTLAGGGRIHLRANIYASFSKANQDGFFSWLQEHGHADLIRETVHSQTLKAFVREQRANGVDLPEDLLSIHDETVAVAVKS